jgi:PemK-like, MazF-like toxin of type II toxin-antitoxin system
MAGFIKGDIVIVPFPFSDLTQTKRRPALVIATLQGNDLILCQITSQSVGDIYAIQLDNSHFNSVDTPRSKETRLPSFPGLFHSHLARLRINSESNSESRLKTTETHVI